MKISVLGEKGKTMYDELVERLRAESYTLEELSIILPRAADAIEELMRRCEQFQYMPPPAWIPVTERLPSVGEKVLVITIGEGKQYVETDTLLATGEWIDYGNVTHWMPLPEPPEEE